MLPSILSHRQTLASGGTIRRTFHDCAKPVMFQTGYEGYEYATGGGTLFVATFGGRPYAITCTHVFQEFDLANLAVLGGGPERRYATPAGEARPFAPTGAAEGGDIVDLSVLWMGDDGDEGFFGPTAYVIDPGTICSSQPGDALLVSGFIKDLTVIAEPDIRMTKALVELVDHGPRSDPFLRQAEGVIDPPPPFERITGLSGSPVHNMTRGALCGMVMRGSLVGKDLPISYMDMIDIANVLAAISRRDRRIERTYRGGSATRKRTRDAYGPTRQVDPPSA